MHMYKLIYYIGKKAIETVLASAPYGVCAAKKKTLKDSTHKIGTLKIEKI